MEIRVLQYFLAIARNQSILRAAESLHLSQPTLRCPSVPHVGPECQAGSPHWP